MRSWKDRGMSFEKLVAMYINDCTEYLSEKGYCNKGFEETENRELIYFGLRELKDACMRAVGKEPINWRD